MLPTSSLWEPLLGLLLLSSLGLQVVLLLCSPLLLSRSRKSRLALQSHQTFPETGWAPFREPRFRSGALYLAGSLFVQLLPPVIFVVALAAEDSACAMQGSGTTECGSMQGIGVLILWILLLPGALVFSLMLYTLARKYFRSAWAANNWPSQMDFAKRPALWFATVLRHVPLLLLIIGFVLSCLSILY